MFPQKLHQQNEDTDKKRHQKQGKETFEDVDVDFFQ